MLQRRNHTHTSQIQIHSQHVRLAQGNMDRLLAAHKFIRAIIESDLLTCQCQQLRTAKTYECHTGALAGDYTT